MIQPFNSNFLTPTKKYRTMSVLMAVHDFPEISQKAIGRITHLSSSMVNNYISDLRKKGFIRVEGATNRTQSYYLTVEGQTILRRSLLLCSAEIVQMYSAVKREISEILNGLYENGARTVGLFGVADTAEIVHAAIKDTRLVVTGVVDSDKNKHGKAFNGLIVQAPESIKEMRPDAIVITSFGKQEEIEERIRQIGYKDTNVIRLSDI